MRRIAGWAGMAAAAAMAFPAAADETADRVRAAADRHAASMVVVRGVVSFEAMGQSRQQKVELPGVVVDGSGLVATAVLKSPMGGAKLTLESPKAVLADGRELDLKEEGNDDEYSLTYFRIDDEADQLKGALPKELKPLDLAAKGKLSLGDPLVVLRRHSAQHPDPIGVEDRVLVVFAKPKTLPLVAGGHPAACIVADGKGDAVGITAVFQETTAEGPRQMLIVLPLDQVAIAVKNLGAPEKK